MKPSVAELITKELSEKRGIEEILSRFKNSVIVQALTITSGNIRKAAVLLQTRPETLRGWMVESKIIDMFPDR